jgi:uncharacterized protein
MRVAIGGASGLLGTALSRRLVDSGHEVLKLVRGTPQSLTQRRWDPDAGRIAAPGLDDVDAVVNLAGAPIAGGRWTKDYKAEIRRSRITTTLTIVTSLSPKGRCQRLLNASAAGFYGNSGNTVVDEDSPAGHGFLSRVTQDWEAAAGHSPISTAVLRTGEVLARQGGYLGAIWPLFNVGLGGRIGDGRQFLSWISLNDHVRAMEFLLTSEVTGPVNLVSPQPVTNAQFTRLFAEQLHRPAFVPTPLSAISLLLGREIVRELLTSGHRVKPTRLLDAGFRFEQPSLREALAAVA